MKLLVNIASFYWIFFVYFLQNQYFIFDTCESDKYLSVILYIIIGILLGFLSLFFLVKQSYKKTSDNLVINKIFPIYREYMPIYLSIVVIALSIKSFVNLENTFSIYIIFLLIYIFFHMSNIGYLNPVWHWFGYRIYKIENEKSTYVFIAYKNKDYKSKMNIDDIRKIDEFTFIKRKD